jgi:hypothetical protein
MQQVVNLSVMLLAYKTYVNLKKPLYKKFGTFCNVISLLIVKYSTISLTLQKCTLSRLHRKLQHGNREP